jgi:hypothetical protein
LTRLGEWMKDRAIEASVAAECAALAERIAQAIERAGAVGQPPRLVATERQAVIDQARRLQAELDARIARQAGQS